MSGSSSSTTAAGPAPQLIFAWLVGNFSEMSFTYRGNTSGTPFSTQASYQIVSEIIVGNVTTYGINMNQTFNGHASSILAYFDSTGNVLNVTASGQTFTGPTATTYLTSFASPFSVYTLQLQPFFSSLTGNSAVILNATATGMVGPTNMTFKDYSALHPFTFGICGPSWSFNHFFMEIGTPVGTGINLLTQLYASGMSGSTSVDYSFILISIAIDSLD